MCVKFKKKNKLVDYDMDCPLERQLEGSEEIIVNYKKSKDVEVDRFLNEIEKVAKCGGSKPAKIKVVENDNLPTARVQKRLQKVERHFNANEVIRNLAISHLESDRKLSEISNLIKNRKQSVKKTG